MINKQIILGVPVIVLAVAIALVLRSPSEHDVSSTVQSSGSDAELVSLRSEPMHRDSNNGKAASSTTAADMKPLLDGMNELRREIEMLKRQRSAESTSQPSDTPLSAEEEQRQEWERTSQTTAFLDDSLQHESRDSLWSSSAEQEVSAAFSSDEIALGSKLQGMSCQTTLCRIRSTHSSADAERSFMIRLGRLDAFSNAEAFSQRSERPDGSVEIVTFVSRSGHRLPAIE